MGFPEPAVPLGCKENVELVFAPTPLDFVLQVCSKSHLLQDLMNKITGLYGNGQGRLLRVDLMKPGTPCIAQYADDGLWYRAVIEAANACLAQVHFVDYGNHERIPVADVREIEPQLLDIPVLGIECHLMGVRVRDDEWTEDMVASFVEMTDGKQLQALFVQRKGSRVEVILEDAEDESKLSINEMFGATFEEVKAAFPATVIAQYTDQVISLGNSELVSVSWFIDPDEFYCQFLSSQTAFTAMMEKIQVNKPREPSLSKCVPVGTPVIAKFAADGVLYRASVKEPKGNSCVVHYVDYGNFAEVDLSEIWPMEPDFLELPPQAVPCSLQGIKPAGPHWSQNDNDFSSYFTAKQLQCTFSSFTSGKYSVDLYVNGQSVAEELVDKGLAHFQQHHIKPANSYDLELLVGQRFCVHVTYIESLCSFFVQLNPHLVTKVNERLNQHVAVSRAKPLPAGFLAKDRLCVASLDGDAWYRAKVINIASLCVHVLFLDYGDVTEIAINRVLPIPVELQSISYAVHCTLNGLQQGHLTETLEASFKREIEATDIIMLVDSVADNRLSVELFDVNGLQLEMLKTVTTWSASTVELPCPMPVYSCKQKVWISHFEDMDNVWLHYTDSEAVLTELLDLLYQFYEAGNSSSSAFAVEEGSLCAVKSMSDGGWYRARVKSVINNSMNVVYIDYGNSEVVPVTNIRELDPSFFKQHSLALQVSLGLVAQDKSKCKAYMIEMASEKELTASFTKISSGWLMVDFYDGDTNLKEVLIKEGLAIECTTISPAQELPPQPTIGVKLLEGERCTVYLSYFESLLYFFVQLIDHSEDVVKLQDELMLNVSDFETYQEPPSVGTLCAAQYAGDFMWYRALVLVSGDPIVKVRFVDYGNTEEVHTKKLKALPQSLQSSPFYAIRCAVSATEMRKIDKMSNLNKLLKSGEAVELEVVESGEPMIVQLSSDSADIQPIEVEPGLPVVTQNKDMLLAEIGNDSKEEDRRNHVTQLHVTSPALFWVQEECAIPELQKMSEQLAEAESFPPLENVREGMVCAARSADDDLWYRAKIMQVVSNIAQVCFIDYGRSCHSTDLRMLPKNLACVLPLARRCSLVLPNVLQCRSPVDEEIAMSTSMLVVDSDGKPMKIVMQEFENIGESRCKGEELHLGVNTTVIVSHINSLNDFWVQFVSQSSQLNEINDKLSHAEQYEPLPEPVDGVVCAVRFPEDDQWYRGEVLSYSDNVVEVLFLDYGNSSTCFDLRCLPKELLLPAPLAKHCSLSLPEGLVQWPQGAEETFLNIIGDGSETFELTLLQKGDPCIVSLSSRDGKVEDKIKKCHTFTNAENEEHDNNPHCGDSEVACSDKTWNCKEQGLVEMSSDLQLSQCVAEQLPDALNAFHTITVSYVISPQDFWVQCAQSASTLKLLKEKLYHADNFDLIPIPVNGALCAALFPEDGQWYRAEIICSGEDRTKVFFMDYGNSSLCTDLRCLPANLLHIPPLAKHCCLKLPEGRTSWTQEAEEEFFNKSANGMQMFMMTIIEEGDPAIVSLKHEGVKVEDQIWSVCRSEAQLHIQDTEDVHNIARVHDTDGAEALVSSSAGTLEVSCDYATVKTALTELWTECSLVTISQATSLADFWVQCNCTMLKEVHDILIDAGSFEPISDPVKGAMCAAFSSENSCWYRARILVSSNLGNVNVFFLDLGKSAWCSDVRCLPTKLVDIPPLAKHCALPIPKGLLRWPDAAEQEFLAVLGDTDKLFKLKILQDGDPCIVSLCWNGQKIEDEIWEKVKDVGVNSTSVFADNMKYVHEVGEDRGLEDEDAVHSFAHTIECFTEQVSNPKSRDMMLKLIKKYKERQADGTLESGRPTEMKHNKFTSTTHDAADTNKEASGEMCNRNAFGETRSVHLTAFSISNTSKQLNPGRSSTVCNETLSPVWKEKEHLHMTDQMPKVFSEKASILDSQIRQWEPANAGDPADSCVDSPAGASGIATATTTVKEHGGTVEEDMPSRTLQESTSSGGRVKEMLRALLTSEQAKGMTRCNEKWPEGPIMTKMDEEQRLAEYCNNSVTTTWGSSGDTENLSDSENSQIEEENGNDNNNIEMSLGTIETETGSSIPAMLLRNLFSLEPSIGDTSANDKDKPVVCTSDLLLFAKNEQQENEICGVNKEEESSSSSAMVVQQSNAGTEPPADYSTGHGEILVKEKAKDDLGTAAEMFHTTSVEHCASTPASGSQEGNPPSQDYATSKSHCPIDTDTLQVFFKTLGSLVNLSGKESESLASGRCQGSPDSGTQRLHEGKSVDYCKEKKEREIREMLSRIESSLQQLMTSVGDSSGKPEMEAGAEASESTGVGSMKANRPEAGDADGVGTRR